MRVLLLLILLVLVSSKPLHKNLSSRKLRRKLDNKLFRKKVSDTATKEQEQQIKPLSLLYPVEEDKVAERFKKLGRNENNVNEQRNVTKVRVRGEEQELVEGDMIAPTVKRLILRDGRPVLQKGSTTGLWPQGIIPYTFASSITGYKKDVILQAMDHWSSQTCLRFHQKADDDVNYVQFFSGNGCYSDLGMFGGKQLISIGPQCVRLGVIVHEIGHAMGFYHEQSRPDRDNYVMIKLQNAKPGTSDNFAKYNRDYIDMRGVPYDYGSIMHYRAKAFSVNGKPTVIPIVEEGEKTPQIGQRIKLSPQDVQLAKSMYKCDVEQIAPPTPPAEEQSCTDLSTMCRDWAAAGLCTMGNFVVFMLKSCQISCGICSIRFVQSQEVITSATLAESEVGDTHVEVRIDNVEEGAKKQQIMHRRAGAEKWNYGMPRKFIASDPLSTVYNLQAETQYEFVVRYSVEADKWSEFSDVLNVTTRPSEDTE